MGFHKLDFLSIAPKNLIFQNTSNKTNFGGILTLFYIFVVLIISVYYLLDYMAKDNFSIEYIRYTHDYNNFYKRDEGSNDARYNPYFLFRFEIFGDDKTERLSKDFKLLNFSELVEDKVSFISRGKPHTKRISDINLQILYKCRDENCTVPFDQIYLYVFYYGFIIDHQNETSPIYLYDKIYAKRFFYSYQNPEATVMKWKIVKYNPDKGLFTFFNKLNETEKEKQKKNWSNK